MKKILDCQGFVLKLDSSYEIVFNVMGIGYYNRNWNKKKKLEICTSPHKNWIERSFIEN